MNERVDQASRDVELYRNLTGNFFNKYQLVTAEVKAMKAELRYVRWEADRAKERRDLAEEKTQSLLGQVEDVTAEKSDEVALARALSAIYQQKALSMERWLLEYVQNKEIQCMQLRAEMLVRSMQCERLSTAEAPYVQMSPEAGSEVRELAGQSPKSSDGIVEDVSHEGKLQFLTKQALAATSRRKKKEIRSQMASLDGRSLQRVVGANHMKPVGKVQR